MSKLRNKTGREHCHDCDDTGWVELAGTTTIGGHTYSKGNTACKWCELGVARFTQHPELAQDFAASDTVPADQGHGRPFHPDADFLRERVAAGCRVEAMQAMFPRKIWPAEWAEPAAGGDKLASLLAADEADHQRRRAAREAFAPITVDEHEVHEKQLRARMALNEEFAPGMPLSEPFSADEEDDQIAQHVPSDDDCAPY